MTPFRTVGELRDLLKDVKGDLPVIHLSDEEGNAIHTPILNICDGVVELIPNESEPQ